MKNFISSGRTVCVFAAVLASTSPALVAATLSNGSLSVVIRTDNGAIDAVSFGGTDYFNAGTPVSNWGLQTGTNTSSFVVNNTSGVAGQTVSVSPTGVVTGTYTAGGANVAFTRSYSIVPGTNTLKIDTNYQNLGPTISLRQFDTFDPDQGQPLTSSFATYNDVYALGGTQVAQARIAGSFTHTVIIGSSSSPYVVASGNPFSIDSGTALNSFFSTPFDGNDALDDSGMHIGFERVMNTGQTTSYSTFIAFGLSPSQAQQSYLNAIPEPSSLMLSVIATLGVLTRRKRA